MFLGEGVFGLVMLAFWVWAIFDVISSEETLVRNLPKFMWLMLVIFLSDIGAIAWLLMGRPENVGFRPGDTTPRQRVIGAEDGPRWAEDHAKRQHHAAMDDELDRRIEERRLREWEEELR